MKLICFVFAILSFQKMVGQNNTLPINTNACPPTENKKALKDYKRAMRENDFKKRNIELMAIIKAYPNYYELAFELGATFFFSKHMPNAKRYLERAQTLCPEYSAYYHYFFGMMAYQDNNLPKAKTLLEKFINADAEIRDKEYVEAKKIVKEITPTLNFLNNPVPFEPKPVFDICTPRDEYLASLSPDNRHLYFIRKKIPESTGPSNLSYGTAASYKEFFCIAKRKGDKWEKGKPLMNPFNYKFNNGGAAITANNQTMYFVICENNQTSYCNIWYTHKNGMFWDDPKSCGRPLNSATWDSQPTISYDGKIMIFSSLRDGGFGQTDLYMALKQDDGTWSNPTNLGNTINTKLGELTPFLHSDSKTLYFSSEGHGSFGKFDIFYSKWNETTKKWSKPVNIGYPINTKYNDVSFFVSLDGKTGYYSSGRLNGPGGLDVYSFPLYKAAQPEQVVYLEGKLEVPETVKTPATIEIKNTETQKTTTIDVDTSTGQYVAIVANTKGDLLVSVQTKGVAFSSRLIEVDKIKSGTPQKVKPIKVEKIKTGGIYRLNDVNFATNSAILSDKAKFIISEFSGFLQANPKLTIAIHGHTDDVGNNTDNLLLSKERANSVKQFLIQLGIDALRLKAQGFGETKPLAPNNSDANRAKNRRTEFVILSQ